MSVRLNHFLFFIGCLLQTNVLLAQTTSFTQSVEAYKNHQYDSAMLYCEQAIQYFRETSQQDSLVLSIVHQTDIVWESQGSQHALEFANQAVAATAPLPETHLARVVALNKRGQLLVHLSRMEAGKTDLLEAAQRIPPNDTVNGTAASLFNNISWMYLNLNHFDEALRYAQRSLDIQLELYGTDARQLMGVYQSLGLIASGAGWFEEAEKYSLRLLELAELNLTADHPTMGLVHNQLAVVYESMCRYPEALQQLRAMVTVTQQSYAKSGNPQFLAIAYNNTGFLYHQLGENSLAEAYFDKALRLHQENFGSGEIGIVQPLAHLAEAKRSLGKYADADSLFSIAYRIQTSFDQENIRGLADLESQIGSLNEDQHNYQTAETWYKSALQRYRSAGVSATTMVDETKTSLANSYAKQGRTTEALQLHREVLAAYQKKYPKGNLLIAGKINRISETYRYMEDWTNALLYSDSTFLELLGLPELPETDWIGLLPISTSVAEFLNNRIAILEKLSPTIPKEHTLETIVQLVKEYGNYLERTIPGLRAESTLVDLAKKQKQLYQSGINAAWILADVYHKPIYLETAFEFAERSKGLLLRLAANNLVVDEHASEAGDLFSTDREWRARISSLNSQYLNTDGTDDRLLDSLTREVEHYRDFQDSVTQLGDSRWRERFDLNPYTIEEIRRLLIRHQETLVEYSVTDHYIYAFLISSKDFKVIQMPRQPISEQVAVLQELVQLDVKEFVNAAFPLYQSLIAPLNDYIEGEKLLVVPDAELFGVNFEVLVSNDRIGGFSSLDYLIRRYEISYLLSASSAIQQKVSRKRKGSNALFFAPGFTKEMKELYQSQLFDNQMEDPIHSQLIRQPFSVQSARETVGMFNGKLYAEEDAKEQYFRNEAANFQLLHLGTHAEVNHISPLQSRLFLAKPSPSDSVSDDGILHAFEVYSMQLQAELAVLSACGTGTGKFQEGEGMISLAHSFLYAGCAAVVMSMWAIDEKTSATLLADFYKNLSDGMKKSTALRQAKLQFLDEMPEELTHPYYWAGLGLIGSTDPLDNSSNNRNSILWGLPLLVIVGLIVFWFRFLKNR